MKSRQLAATRHSVLLPGAVICAHWANARHSSAGGSYRPEVSGKPGQRFIPMPKRRTKPAPKPAKKSARRRRDQLTTWHPNGQRLAGVWILTLGACGLASVSFRQPCVAQAGGDLRHPSKSGGPRASSSLRDRCPGADVAHRESHPNKSALPDKREPLPEGASLAGTST